MNHGSAIYEIVSGPLVWISFAVFFFGLGFQLVNMLREARKDRLIYPYMNAFFGLRSLIHWVIPFGSRNMRLRPEVTIVTFSFHVCLIAAPVFNLGHNILLEQSMGIHWWTLSEKACDLMTQIVIFCGIFFLLRRLLMPEVRFVTTSSDCILLAVVVSPFVTGFLAHHRWFHYEALIIIHILCGEVMLAAIPLTRLRHMIFFPFTRAYMGSEFGAVRHARDW